MLYLTKSTCAPVISLFETVKEAPASTQTPVPSHFNTQLSKTVCPDSTTIIPSTVPFCIKVIFINFRFWALDTTKVSWAGSEIIKISSGLPTPK